MIKAPKFWQNRNFITEILIPISVIYFIIIRIKYFLLSKNEPFKATVPVVCIGNPTSGGAGKTPTAIALANLLNEKGKKIAFVSKGYKGKFKETIKVDITTHNAFEVGDEPLILARYAPCYVCKTRKHGIEAAIKDGANIIILDDGLQDRTIVKDITISVIDGSYGLGNHLVIPAGPLRDRLDISFKHTDIILIIGDDNNNIREEIPSNLPILTGRMIPEEIPDNTQKYIAFAGIGMPDKFFYHLESIGLDIVGKYPFPDHHKYTKRQLRKLLDDAIFSDAKLITTQKDAIRIDEKYINDIVVYAAGLGFKEEKELISYFQDYI